MERAPGRSNAGSRILAPAGRGARAVAEIRGGPQTNRGSLVTGELWTYPGSSAPAVVGRLRAGGQALLVRAAAELLGCRK